MSLKWLFLTAKKFNLILPGYFSNANLFENLWLRWSCFWEMGREAANHHLSHQFVIRQSMVLKKKILWTAEAVTWMSSVKKNVLQIFQYTQGNTCVGVFFKYSYRSSACNFIRKETAVQMFSWEFCKIFMTQFWSKSPDDYFWKSTGFH